MIGENRTLPLFSQNILHDSSISTYWGAKYFEVLLLLNGRRPTINGKIWNIRGSKKIKVEFSKIETASILNLAALKHNISKIQLDLYLQLRDKQKNDTRSSNCPAME